VSTQDATSSPPREGQVFGGESLAARYASFVKLPHTLFALPFAGFGAVLASYEHAGRIGPMTIVWILIAFTAARFAAMGFNRIVDRAYDAANPRTRMREIPAGRLTLGQAWGAVIGASILFVAAAWLLNPLCGVLAPIALAWVFFYSYTKRFTAMAHHVLGVALGIAPVGAYLAVAGAWTDPWYALPLLAGAVMFWVAGFDVIYALQDVAFDREHGLRSIPAALGPRAAISLARLFHVLSVVCFVLLWALGLFPVGVWYLAALGVMIALLLYVHAVVHGVGEAIDLPRIDRAFFRANIGVSTTIFVLTLVDRIVAGGSL
jgi:4-hydroxybenzoate polyprenyltransferase